MTARSSLSQGLIATHQGLIATHNPDLFQELFASPSPDISMGESGDAPMHKLYAEGDEGGHFTEEDEDKYRFISDKIEDFDEKQYSMLLDSSRKDSHSRGKSQAGQTPRRNGQGTPPSQRLSAKSHKTQFVVKDRNRYMTEEERDLEDLRREERYQARLRQKLHEFEEKRNVFIPKLELGDSDEEEKARKKTSLPFDISLRDSLEDEAPKKSLAKAEETKMTPQRAPLEHVDSLEDQHEHHYQQQQQQQQQQFTRDSLEWATLPPHQVGEYQPQPGVHGNDPLSRMFHPEDGVTAGTRQWNDELPSEPHEGHAGYYISDVNAQVQDDENNNEYHTQENIGQMYDQRHEGYPPPTTHAEPSQGDEAERYDNIRRKHDQKLGSKNDLRLNHEKQEMSERPKPDIDYIERNKEISRKKDSKSYSALHAKKKQPESPIKPSSAEHTWHGQSQGQNMGRTDGRSYRGGPGHGPLRKYPSESRVDEMKLQKARAAPHRVGPIAHRPVPIEAFQDLAPTVYPNQNSPHAVYTDGGQRLDVEVNVKAVPERQEAHPVYAYDNYYDPRYNHYGSVGNLDGPPHPYNNHGYGQHRPPGYSDAHGYNYPHHGNQYYHGDGYHDYEQTTQQYNYQPPYHPNQQEDWSHQPSIRGSYRGSITTTERSQTPVGSPYKILPPINMDDQNDTPPRIRASPRNNVSPGREEGSYMEAFRSKKNKKADYKKYTLNDYRKLNQEVHRGGLGPEVNGDEYRNRKEKAQRQQEYARMIAEKNRNEMEVAKARPEIIKRPEEDDFDDAFRRHIMAKEYAKSIPKPKPRSKPPSGAPPSGSSTQRSNTSDSYKTNPSSGVSRREKTPLVVETVDLEALQKRHEEEKRKAEMIRQNVTGAH